MTQQEKDKIIEKIQSKRISTENLGWDEVQNIGFILLLNERLLELETFIQGL